MIGPLDDLVEALCRLPTIGRKSAWRLALFLMERPLSEATRLAEAITAARSRLRQCIRCFNYSEDELCSVCTSPTRETDCICVVEKAVDVFAIERGGKYRGLYHVLGGVLAPLNGVTVDKLHIAELGRRIHEEHPHEIIIGLGGSADAETTALYLGRLFKDEPVRITRLARGLPAGMELEFADQITLTHAFHERTDMHYGKTDG
jgi:recombination protein RecR